MNTDSHGLKTDLHGCDIERLLARSTLYQALSILFRHPMAVPPYLTSDSHALRGNHYESVGTKWQQAVGILETYFPSPLMGEGQASGFPRLRREASTARRGGGGNSLRRSLNSLLSELKITSREDWIHQYETCFGHTAHARVPIYELEYGEEHSFREPRQLADITAFYRAFGLRINKNSHERADHLAVECEFVHFLTYKAAYALEHDGEEKFFICNDASRNFLSDHLGRWLPAFSSCLSKYSEKGIMKAIADFAFLFIIEDCKRLGIKPGPSYLPIRAVRKQEENNCHECPIGQF